MPNTDCTIRHTEQQPSFTQPILYTGSFSAIQFITTEKNSAKLYTNWSYSGSHWLSVVLGSLSAEMSYLLFCSLQTASTNSVIRRCQVSVNVSHCASIACKLVKNDFLVYYTPFFLWFFELLKITMQVCKLKLLRNETGCGVARFQFIPLLDSGLYSSSTYHLIYLYNVSQQHLNS